MPPNCQKIYDGIMFNIYHCDVELFDGSKAKFEYLTRQDSVTILAFPSPDTIILTRQEQPGRPEPFIDFPGGRVDEGETHEQAALREFQEETGYKIGRIITFKHFALMGSTRFEKTFFVATDLQKINEINHHEPGEKIEIFIESIDKVLEHCHNWKLRQTDGMLCFLNIMHNPKINKQITSWLNNSTSADSNRNLAS